MRLQGLAGLFQAPSALMFQGTFEEAKAKAVEEGKWLVSSSSTTFCKDVGHHLSVPPCFSPVLHVTLTFSGREGMTQ